MKFLHFNKFDLSTIASFFAEQRLMASNGRVGLRQGKRAFNENMSLDSMLICVKAYGEIYRLLGHGGLRVKEKKLNIALPF